MSHNNGYIAFTTLLIISAVALTIALTISSVAISQNQMTQSLRNSNDTFYLADACMEDALERIKDSPTYSGGTFTLLDGSCTISTVSVGNDWTINVVATDSTHTKTIEVEATRASGVTINTWEEQ